MLVLLMIAGGALAAAASGGVLASAHRADRREKAEADAEAHRKTEEAANQARAAAAEEERRRAEQEATEVRRRRAEDPRSWLAMIFRQQRAPAHSAASQRLDRARVGLERRTEERDRHVEELGGRPTGLSVLSASARAAAFVIAAAISLYVDVLLFASVLGWWYVGLAALSVVMGVMVSTMIEQWRERRRDEGARLRQRVPLAVAAGLGTLWVVALLAFGLGRGEVEYATKIADAQAAVASLEADPIAQTTEAAQVIANEKENVAKLESEKATSTAIVIAVSIMAFAAEIALWPAVPQLLGHRRLRRADSAVAEAESEVAAATAHQQAVTDETLRLLTAALYDLGLPVNDNVIRSGTQYDLEPLALVAGPEADGTDPAGSVTGEPEQPGGASAAEGAAPDPASMIAGDQPPAVSADEAPTTPPDVIPNRQVPSYPPETATGPGRGVSFDE